jgi:hypothetical protein
VRCIHPAGQRPPMPPAMAFAAEERAP